MIHGEIAGRLIDTVFHPLPLFICHGLYGRLIDHGVTDWAITDLSTVYEHDSSCFIRPCDFLRDENVRLHMVADDFLIFVRQKFRCE